MYSTRYSRKILMKLEFSLPIFEKILKISNFKKIQPVGPELSQTERLTDKHNETKRCLSQFWEHA
jgi:hypothetical protein